MKRIRRTGGTLHQGAFHRERERIKGTTTCWLPDFILSRFFSHETLRRAVGWGAKGGWLNSGQSVSNPSSIPSFFSLGLQPPIEAHRFWAVKSTSELNHCWISGKLAGFGLSSPQTFQARSPSGSSVHLLCHVERFRIALYLFPSFSLSFLLRHSKSIYIYIYIERGRESVRAFGEACRNHKEFYRYGFGFSSGNGNTLKRTEQCSIAKNRASNIVHRDLPPWKKLQDFFPNNYISSKWL